MRGAILKLAMTFFLEGQNQGDRGIELIADTVWNRAKGKPDKLIEVISEPRQYECWNNRDINTVEQPNIRLSNDKVLDIWFYCWDLAKSMLDGNYTPTTDATHYWRKDMELKAWQYNMITLSTYKDHVFAKEP